LNRKITYSLTGEHAQNFTIDSSTGVVRAVYDLQRSSTKVFNLEVEAQDGGKPPKKASAELKVSLLTLIMGKLIFLPLGLPET